MQNRDIQLRISLAFCEVTYGLDEILDVEWTKDETTNRRVPEYLVHFNGWNSSWDRWAPAHYILRYTDENLELKGKLHRQALAKMGKKKKKKTLAELVELARKRKAGKGSDSDMSSGVADSDDSDDSSSSAELEAVEIPIPLPEALKTKLEDDCYFITRKNKLVKLPCEHTILSIMEGYIRHFAINVQVHEKKRSQSQNVVSTVAKEGLVPPPQPKYNVDLCKEVMDGLRIIFDFLLPTNLLYSVEHQQYKKIVVSCYVKDAIREAPSPVKRGRPRKQSASSSPTKETTKPIVDTKNTSEKPKEEPTRRVTRRLSTSGQITLADPLPPVKRRCPDVDHHPRSPYPKRHSVDTSNQNKDTASSSAGTNPSTSRPVLRHSARLSSVSSIPSSPTPETQPEVTPLIRSESTESSQSSSNNGKVASHNGKNSAANGCDMKLPSCRLLDDNANYDGKILPCKMYGAQHLMRLFVKLPELLGKMDLPPKKLRPLLKHIELFLKYLAHPDRLEEFFPESAYVASHQALKPSKET
ncbi:male-specific lethal 3 homolog isoform X2 [Acanthaster planci]|uniref:Male-specific lethal 3 homolog isoform X2 n=1 Tax=Acanthaster planci TaxID=133434 RepID=A0A8B7XL34_ACAPL|nr:male-specific lethal 3 homolog isoform X2 [Acanthaster planci]